MTILDNHVVTLQCGKCKRTVKKTLGWLNLHRRCPYCKGRIDPGNYDAVNRELANMEQTLKSL